MKRDFIADNPQLFLLPETSLGHDMSEEAGMEAALPGSRDSSPKFPWSSCQRAKHSGVPPAPHEPVSLNNCRRPKTGCL
jgi:hypothetical protein